MAGITKDDPRAHVQTVQCPICKRAWTGIFENPKDAPCRDCIAEKGGEGRKGHPDLSINPNRD